MLVAAILPFFSTLAGGFAALRLRHRIHAIMALAAPVLVALAGIGAVIVLAVRAAAPV